MAGSYHVDSSSKSSIDTVPTAAELAGNFSAYSNLIYDPASTAGTFAAGNLARTPFPGNIIPTSRFSTMWNAIAANNPFAAPQPGVGSITNTGPSGNIVTSGTGNYFNLTNQFRVDHNFSDKLKASSQFLRRQPASARQQRQHHLRALRSVPDAARTRSRTRGSVGTYTFSPTFISETKVGEYRITGNGGTKAGATTPTRWPRPFPIFPRTCISIPIGLGLATEGSNASNQLGVGTMSVHVNNVRQFNQDFTKVWGLHSFKFGYEYLWENEDRTTSPTRA